MHIYKETKKIFHCNITVSIILISPVIGFKKRKNKKEFERFLINRNTPTKHKAMNDVPFQYLSPRNMTLKTGRCKSTPMLKQSEIKLDVIDKS